MTMRARLVPEGSTMTSYFADRSPAKSVDATTWWLRNGGTLVADGSATATAIELFDLPIEPVLPQSQRRRSGQQAAAETERTVPASAVNQALREAFRAQRSSSTRSRHGSSTRAASSTVRARCWRSSSTCV